MLNNLSETKRRGTKPHSILLQPPKKKGGLERERERLKKEITRQSKAYDMDRAWVSTATFCIFCVARIWESRDHGTLFWLCTRRGGGVAFCCAHMGVLRSWHPIFFCFFVLRACGSPAIMAPYFLAFCVARIWESRDHGALYFLAFLRCAHKTGRCGPWEN
jgi:hypothetical protein